MAGFRVPGTACHPSGYHRVLANSPSSQNYIDKDIFYSGRFAVWLAEKAKKADLMFVQHMLAVLTGDAELATKMLDGVLFRGGEGRNQRRRRRSVRQPVRRRAGVIIL